MHGQIRNFVILILLSLTTVSCAEKFGSASSPYLFESEPVVRTLIIESDQEIGVRADGRVEISSLAKEDKITTGDKSFKLGAKDKDVVLLDESGREMMITPVLQFNANTYGAKLLIAGVKYGEGWWWEGQEDRQYEGIAEFRVGANGKLNAIIELPIEEYLRGVVPSEIGANSPDEALKVQAIAARGETLVALRTRKYAGEFYDICADVNCQVFSGNRRRSDAADAAIVATRGLALFYEGEPIGAYYASSCGGHSENADLAWPDRHPQMVPYWSGIPDNDSATAYDLTSEENTREWILNPPADAYCNPKFITTLPEWTHRNFRWERVFDADSVTTHVAVHQDIGRVLAIEPGPRGPSGRLTKVTFVGEKGRFQIGPELAIRRVFTPPLRSAAFIVDVEGDPNRPDKFIIRGAGYGHGVGMCQTGAIGRALAGQTYDQILTHYYQGTEIHQAYP